MRPAPPHYRPKTKRRHQVLYGILLGTTLSLLLETQQREPPPDDPQTTKRQSPSASYAVRIKRLERPQPKPPSRLQSTPEPDTNRAFRRSERVLVTLQTADDGLLMTSRAASLDPSAFWPLPDEVPFPEGQTAPDLQEIIHHQVEAGSEQERDWLDLAWEEGLAPDTVDISEDPWAGLLAMEAARRASRVEQLDLYNDALDSWPQRDVGMITPRALVGPPEVDSILALADDIIDTHPEHPASEFARLYILRATALRGGKEDIKEAWETAQDLLRHTDDALVLGQAVGLLANLHTHRTLSGPDLDQIADVLADGDDLVDPIDVSVFALNQALKNDDRRRSRQWASRYETYLDAFCRVEHQSPRCDQHRDNLDLAVAYIGDLTTADATNWRQAFHIAAYSCAREGYLGSERLEVHVGWEGDHWQFQQWQPLTTLLAACIENEIPLGPQPDNEPFDVHLTIIPPS